MDPLGCLRYLGPVIPSAATRHWGISKIHLSFYAPMGNIWYATVTEQEAINPPITCPMCRGRSSRGGGSAWIPVEITSPLQKGFLAAQSAGSQLVRKCRANGPFELIPLSEARTSYPGPASAAQHNRGCRACEERDRCSVRLLAFGLHHCSIHGPACEQRCKAGRTYESAMKDDPSLIWGAEE